MDNKKNLLLWWMLLASSSSLLLPFSMSNCKNMDEPKTYNVTFDDNENKTYTIKGNKQASSDSDYSIEIKIIEGYELDSIEIKCGASKISKKDYLFDSKINILTIYKQAIKGNISITINTKPIVKIYNVTFNDQDNNTYSAVDKKEQATSDQDYVATIQFNEDYEFDSISITCGDKTLNESDYQFENNILTIFKQAIQGNISITINTKQKTKTYSVTFDDNENVTYKIKGNKEVSPNNDYTVEIEFIEGYEYDGLEIKCKDEPIQPSNEGYEFNSETNFLTIYKEAIQGNISITINTKQKPIEYKISFVHEDEQQPTYTGKIEESEDKNKYIATVICNDDYAFVEQNYVEIRCGEDKLIPGENYEFELIDNVLTITFSKSIVTNNIYIAIKTQQKAKTYNVTFNDQDNDAYSVVDKMDYATFGQDYVATIELDEHYEFISIAITCDSKPLNESDYKFENNILTIYKQAIQGDISITINTRQIIPPYKINFVHEDEQQPTYIGEIVILKNNYVATVTCNEDYEFIKPDCVEITRGKEKLTPFEDYDYSLDQDNKLTIVFDLNIVTNDIYITINTKPKAKTYDVTFAYDKENEKCTIKGENYATNEEDYIAFITCYEGYEIDLDAFKIENVSLSKNLILDQDYFLIRENCIWTIRIVKNAIKGNIVISFKNKVVYYDVFFNDDENKTYTVKDKQTKATPTSDYIAEIKFAEGYELEDLEIICNEAKLITPNNYEFDAENNILTIYKRVISGDITITITTKIAEYSVDVKYDKNTCSVEWDKKTTSFNDYSIEIKFFENYELDNFEIKCKDITIQQEDYKFENNILIIYKWAINGNLEIIIETKKIIEPFDVTFNDYEKTTYDIVAGNKQTFPNEDYIAKIKCNEYYKFAEFDNFLVIECNQNPLQVDKDYKFIIGSDSVLTITINGEVIIGNISIVVKTQPIEHNSLFIYKLNDDGLSYTISFDTNGKIYDKQLFNEDIIIPAYHPTDGKTITKIDDGFLEMFSSFNSKLIIPSGINTIGKNFLNYCKAFNNMLIIPKSINYIGDGFLSNCWSFNQPLTIPSSVIKVGEDFMYDDLNFNSVLTIDCSADCFANSNRTCAVFSSDEKCYIDGITIGGQYAQDFVNKFANSKDRPYRKLVLLPKVFDFVKYVLNSDGQSYTLIMDWKNSTYSQQDFNENITIFSKHPIDGKPITAIGDYFLEGCSSFNSVVTIQEGIKYIGKKFLSSCKKFNHPITFPITILSIGDGFLSGCEEFNWTIVLPKAVTSIGDYFMSDCSKFNQTLLFQDGIKIIGGHFMSDCEEFNQALTIPSSLESIGTHFMFNCFNFTNLVVNCSADVFEDSSSTCATWSKTATCYQEGISISGKCAEEFVSKFRNSAYDPYRKLILKN